MNRKTILVTGGARSGKSGFALDHASRIPGKKAFIATAEPNDSEMKERIKRHKRDRGEGWDTYEEPLKIALVIEEIEMRYRVIVIDCLTLWLGNLMLINADIDKEISGLIETLRSGQRTSSLYLVSNEVGMGIVPENEIARRFRDMAGFLNQKVASTADEVYMTVSGIPVKIKGGSSW
jgi:adenosylcobinamide kinase/adenosylcobinamide-phosphate guanylyltransferase